MISSFALVTTFDLPSIPPPAHDGIRDRPWSAPDPPTAAALRVRGSARVPADHGQRDFFPVWRRRHAGGPCSWRQIPLPLNGRPKCWRIAPLLDPVELASWINCCHVRVVAAAPGVERVRSVTGPTTVRAINGQPLPTGVPTADSISARHGSTSPCTEQVAVGTRISYGHRVPTSGCSSPRSPDSDRLRRRRLRPSAIGCGRDGTAAAPRRAGVAVSPRPRSRQRPGQRGRRRRRCRQRAGRRRSMRTHG